MDKMPTDTELREKSMRIAQNLVEMNKEEFIQNTALFFGINNLHARRKSAEYLFKAINTISFAGLIHGMDNELAKIAEPQEK